MAEPPIVGYGAVAACMNADHDLAIYRRFGTLNTRNLLYLQSELSHLEEKLKELDSEANDQKSGINGYSVLRSWYHLEKQNGEHLKVVLEIRDKLEKYSTKSCSSISIIMYKRLNLIRRMET
jgi:hypothetical protein